MSDVLTLVVQALPLAFIWLFVVRPTQRRSSAAKELSRSLQPGQRVMTTSGLFGVVAGLDDETVRLEVAEGVTLEFARRAVATVIPEQTPDPGPDEAAGQSAESAD